MPTFLELLSARVPLSLLSCSRSTSSVVDIARRHWRRAGDKLVVPHTFPWIKRATEQRAAARFPLLSVPRHATQREVHALRTLASTLSAPGGRPMLRPEALPSYYQWPPSLRHVRLLTALHVQLLMGLSGVLAPIHIVVCTVRSVSVLPILMLLIVSLSLLVVPLNVWTAAGVSARYRVFASRGKFTLAPPTLTTRLRRVPLPLSCKTP